MKLKNILLYLLPIAGLCSSCNDEWENEQFTHYISFKAPINSDGVSRINVRYRSGNEKTTFQLPIIVSGSTTNERNITVDRKSTRLNSSHGYRSRMPSSA